jgi:hypothetical protein
VVVAVVVVDDGVGEGAGGVIGCVLHGDGGAGVVVTVMGDGGDVVCGVRTYVGGCCGWRCCCCCCWC